LLNSSPTSRFGDITPDSADDFIDLPPARQ